MSAFTILFWLTLVHACWGQLAWWWPVVFAILAVMFAAHKQRAQDKWIEDFKKLMWKIARANNADVDLQEETNKVIDKLKEIN